VAKYGIVGVLTRREGGSALRLAAFVGASCAAVGIPIARLVDVAVAVAVAVVLALVITLVARTSDEESTE
jgi:hypothetical protein